MEIETLYCLEGAKAARGVAVVLDVFRAGNTAAALLAAGAPFIRPVAGIEEAMELKHLHPDWLFVGERQGLKPAGFDMNNSPTEALKLDLTGRPVVMTTSAGTMGLTASAAGADVLLMASLVNAARVVEYVLSLKPERVSLVAIGLEAKERAEEDDAVAAYLTDLMRGRPVDYRRAVRRMLSGGGADRLRRLGQWRDLAFCLRRDYMGIIPKAEWTDGRLILKAAGVS